MNEAFGDAHVEWKMKEAFTGIELMATPWLYPEGSVGAARVNGDTCFF